MDNQISNGLLLQSQPFNDARKGFTEATIQLSVNIPLAATQGLYCTCILKSHLKYYTYFLFLYLYNLVVHYLYNLVDRSLSSVQRESMFGWNVFSFEPLLFCWVNGFDTVCTVAPLEIKLLEFLLCNIKIFLNLKRNKAIKTMTFFV